MKPVVKEEDLVPYIDDSRMIEFISINSDMPWNKCCKYVQEHGICSDEGHRVFWDDDIFKQPEQFNEHQVKWITAFFEAHPFLTRFYLVFDN